MTTAATPGYSIRLHPDDTVLIAARDLTPGTVLPELTAPLTSDVPAGHKVAARRLAAGELVRMFGQVIGEATPDIQPGEHVHTHNRAFLDITQQHTFGADAGRRPPVELVGPTTFDGFVRADGRAATRNFVGILTSVNCPATAAQLVADGFRAGEQEFAPWQVGAVM